MKTQHEKFLKRSLNQLVYASSAMAMKGMAHPDSWPEIDQHFDKAVIEWFRVFIGRDLTEQELLATRKVAR